MRNVIFGAGGFGREVATALRNAGTTDLVFVTDSGQVEDLLGLPAGDPASIRPTDNVYLAVGDGSVREQIVGRLAKSGCRFKIFVAKTAVVSSDAVIGEGSIFSDFTMVTAPAHIGRQFQCNIYSYVAHDCEIGEYVTFAPRVCCNGNVRIGNFAYIGTNATIRQGVSIGAHAIVGMGAVVVKDVPKGATVMGNPARVREG